MTNEAVLLRILYSYGQYTTATDFQDYGSYAYSQKVV